MREHVPAAKKMSPNECLDTIGGNPGALDRIIRGRPKTRKELESIARNARNFHYPEVPRILHHLREHKRDLFDVAIRLALLPEIDSTDLWRHFEPAFDLAGRELADLCDVGLTEDGFFPYFGHTQRYDTARDELRTRYAADVSQQASRLVMDLAACCGTGDNRELPFVASIAMLWMRHDWLRLDEPARALSALVAGGVHLAPVEMSMARAAVAHAGREYRVAPLCAMMLFNTLSHAKDEDDLPRRDALLEELRALHRTPPEDAAVRERLAKGLFNTLVDVRDEDDLPRRDALLEELRDLHEQFGDDAMVRTALGLALAVRGKERLELPDQAGACDDLREAMRHLDATSATELKEQVKQLIAEHCGE